MFKKLLQLKTLLIALLVMTGAGNVWAEDVTFEPSDFSGQGTSGTGSAISATKDGVTFACDKGYGTTQFRCYKGAKITISSSNIITAISFTFSGSYNGGLETSYENLSETTWEKKLGSQARITKVTVTYSASTSACATPTFSPVAGTYTSAQNVTLSTTTDGAAIYYTTDGTDPTTSSSSYSSAIPVSTTTTIKAIAVKEGMENSYVASATYTIVSLAHAGTEEDPYTVADARTAIDANVGMTDVYAKGIVSEIVTAYSSEYENITFDIVDENGTATLRAYRCSGTEAANVQVGDIVVVSGNLTKYNDIYEFAADNQLISLDRKEAAVLESIALSGTYPTTFTEGAAFSHEGMTVTATYSDESTKDVTNDAIFSGYDMETPGNQTVTVSYTEGDVTKTATYEITVNAAPSHNVTWSVNGETTVVPYNEGANISFPANPDDINDKTFVGWVMTPIAGVTDTAPTYVTEAKMGDADVTYYAVFAEESIGQGPVEKYLTITPSDFTSLTNSYTETSTTKTVEGEDYTIEIQACLQSSQIQMRDNDNISFIYFPQLPGNVKNVSTTTCHNAGDGAYNGTIHLKSSKTRGNADTNDIVKAVLSSVNSFSIDVTGNVTSFYFVTSAGLRLGNLTVTYEGIGDVTIYSGYCTTVPEDVRTPVNLTGFSATVSTIVRGDDLQTTVTNDQSGWDASYTYSSDNTSVATVDDNGTITAVGRGTANISVALNVDKNDTQYKRGETSNATIEITVVNPSHTATFYNDGMVVSSLSVQEEDDIEFPSDQTAEGYAFIGWTTSEIDEPQSTQPELTNSAVMGTSDMNFYAVFARLSETEGWRKIGGLQTLAAGTYAIITEDGYAFNGTISSGHGQSTNEAFSFTDSVATSAPTGTCLIELIKVEGGFKLYNPTTEKYLYAEKASSGNLAWHSTENSYWRTPSKMNIVYNANGAYLRVYNNTFRTYAGSSNGNPLYFAMKTTIPSYSNYCTTIPTLTISLNAACHDAVGMVYGTYSSSHPFVVSDDVVVSEISIVNDAFHVEAYETGAVVPANRGVMVSALEGGNYTVNVATTAGTSVLGTANCLRPTGDNGITAVDMGAADTGCLFYRLTMHNGTQIGYWWGAENGAAFKVAANKAYMAIPKAQAARMMGNGFSEIFTGIVSTEQQRESVATYNLLGQRVSPDTKGVLIRNGKKLINK